jgi:hypothetical protein
MPSNERKLELEQHLRSSPYPPRAKAQFTAANDHNPLILQDCPECRGTGKRDLFSKDASGARWTLGACSACGGKGITGEVEPYFLNDVPEVAARPNSEGYLRCPGCGIAFTTRDPHRWTGYRHIRCGQRIRTSTDDA